MTKLNSPKRQAILAAATTAFIKHGYSGVSMEAIAEAAPVSKPTLYNHFNSKQELFAAVIAVRCAALIDTLSRLPAEQSDPLQGLKDILREFVELVYADEAMRLYRLIVSEQQNFPEIAELMYRSGPEQVLQKLCSYLTELHRLKLLYIPDVSRSGRLLLGMVKGHEHFRCLLGLQAGLSAVEKCELTNAAFELFVKGHAIES